MDKKNYTEHKTSRIDVSPESLCLISSNSGDSLSNMERNDVDVIPVMNPRRRPRDSNELRFLRSC
ncbi:hypothetical protein HanIR_Chr10g0466421 [Helianthus annuus]|nr:hypothetical protein HanIR_Chr10g0466421 [Helianthus annuus]